MLIKGSYFSQLFRMVSHLLGFYKKDRLNYLQSELIILLATYLTIDDLKQLQKANKEIFAKLYKYSTIVYRDNRIFSQPITVTVGNLVSTQGEDTLVRLENLLKVDLPLVKRAVSKPIDNFQDHSRIFTTPISPYGYCFWVGDTEMCIMMQKYMDEDTKNLVHAECKEILENGANVKFKDGKSEENYRSKFFDLTPIIKSHQAFQSALANNNTENMNTAWRLITQETKNLPLWIIQTYCRDDQAKKRTIIFSQPVIENNECVMKKFSWFAKGKIYNGGVLMSNGRVDPNYKGEYFYSGNEYDHYQQLKEDLQLLLDIQNARPSHIEKSYNALLSPMQDENSDRSNISMPN